VAFLRCDTRKPEYGFQGLDDAGPRARAPRTLPVRMTAFDIAIGNPESAVAQGSQASPGPYAEDVDSAKGNWSQWEGEIFASDHR
jgi:hypothetical protein